MAACSSTNSKNAETGKNYRIAFNVWEDKESDNYEVYTMNMDGSDQVNVTNLAGVEWTYRSLGNELLYISDKDTCHRCYFLYSTNATGNEHNRIGGYQLRDSWMDGRNNGQEIIVNPKIENDSAFYIIDRKGQLIQKVYAGMSYYSDPAFSPSGEEIVFRGSKKRFKKDIGYQDELYIVGVDGANLRQLTYYPKEDTTANWWNYHAGPPFWEPNSNLITFHSVQGGGSYLFQIHPDGSGLKKIPTGDLKVGWHSWSSDGKWIVFDAETSTGEGEETFNIYLLEYETGQIKQLTFKSRFEQSPVFVEVDN
jgi:TolB protein